MGLVSYHRGTVGAAVLLALLTTGCGGSVTDADAAPSGRALAAKAAPFCAAVQANADAIRPLGNLSPDAFVATVDTARRSGLTLVDTAPREIQPDVQRVVTAMGVELDALVAARGDAAKAARDPAVAAQYSSPDVSASGQRVNGYVNQNCRPG